jgi:hypothetical protein
MKLLRIENSTPPNYRLKLTGHPVTALAINVGGRGTGPSCARAAPGHPAAYPKRYTAILWWKIWA